MALTSSPKSNSLGSRPKATKRQKATPRTSLKTSKTSSARRGAVSRPQATKAKRGSSVRSGNALATSSRVGQGASSLRQRGRTQAESTKQGPSRIAFIAAVSVGVLAAVAVVVLLVLSRMPVFVINSIDAVASEHVSAESIAKLANIEEGTTLLGADMNQITANIKRNPWVKDVNITREFPDTLSISLEEREVGAVVVIGAGASVWALGTDGVWIEPVQLDASGVDVATAALARAQELGCLLITDVPASVDPAQGSETTDDTIQAVLTYQAELPEDLSSQARVYYASSEGSISLVLDSGLEISLGSPEDINSKSMALNEIIATYPGQLTYINVRVPSKPTYRKVPDGTTLSDVGEVVAANAESAAAQTADATTEDSSSDKTSGDSE